MDKKEREIVGKIIRGEEFEDKNGMWASKITPQDMTLIDGLELPELLRAMFRDDDPDYVVGSYAFPIAWHIPAMERWSRDEEFGHQVVFHVPEQWRRMNQDMVGSRYQDIVEVALVLANEKGSGDSDKSADTGR